MTKPLSTLAKTDLTDRQLSPVNHFGQIWEIWHLESVHLAVECAAQKRKRKRLGGEQATSFSDPKSQSGSCPAVEQSRPKVLARNWRGVRLGLIATAGGGE